MIIRKPQMVQRWKQDLAAIARVIAEKLKALGEVGRRFWVRFTKLADDARREVRSGYPEELRGKPFKTLASKRPHRPGNFWVDGDGALCVDKLRAMFWKLKNGDLHPVIMMLA